MKIMVLLILVMCVDRLYSLACLILMLVSWNSHLKLVFVMILTPCCMNALQFWLTDNFIQKGGVSYKQVAHGCYHCCVDCSRWAYCKSAGRDSSRHHPHDGPHHEEPSREEENGDRPHSGSLAEPLLAPHAHESREDPF